MQYFVFYLDDTPFKTLLLLKSVSHAYGIHRTMNQDTRYHYNFRKISKKTALENFPEAVKLNIHLTNLAEKGTKL